MNKDVNIADKIIKELSKLLSRYFLIFLEFSPAKS